MFYRAKRAEWLAKEYYAWTLRWWQCEPWQKCLLMEYWYGDLRTYLVPVARKGTADTRRRTPYDELYKKNKPLDLQDCPAFFSSDEDE